MKQLVLFISFLLCVATTQAQLKDTTLSLSGLRKNPGMEARYRQQLIQLALQNPNMDELKAREEINKYEIRNAKAAWLNHFVANGNLNEYSIKGSSNNNFFPRYNFGVTLPLGNLVTVPNNVKIAKTQRKVLTAQKRTDSIATKVSVLNMYEIYVANEQLMELQIPVLNDVYSNYSLQEDKFKKGEITVEEFNAAYRIYNTEKATNINLKRELEQSRINLEGMIGTTLEEVLRQIK